MLLDNLIERVSEHYSSSELLWLCINTLLPGVFCRCSMILIFKRFHLWKHTLGMTLEKLNHAS
jgi:hypothetical protein